MCTLGIISLKNLHVCPLSVYQRVWSAGSRCVRLCISAERANGDETVNLWDGGMESLHMSAAGCLLMSYTICVTLLHSDPTHRSLDRPAQYEKKLFYKGKCKEIKILIFMPGSYLKSNGGYMWPHWAAASPLLFLFFYNFFLSYFICPASGVTVLENILLNYFLKDLGILVMLAPDKRP